MLENFVNIYEIVFSEAKVFKSMMDRVYPTVKKRYRKNFSSYKNVKKQKSNI